DTFGPFNGANGGTGTSVLGNDELNGAVVNPADVVITEVHGATPVVTGGAVPTLDPADGVVTVPVGTPAGEYHITYRICEVLNPTNCDDAIVTVVVEAPAIVANDNDYSVSNPVNGKDGGS